MTAAPAPRALEHLLSPFRLGGLELRNRVVMAPHSTHYADRVESPRLTAYYAERARGGVGMIVHEPVIVHPSSRSRQGKIWGYDEENAVAYRATTDAVHAAGTRIVCQLIHNGRQVDGFESLMPAWYPSETQRAGTIEVTHAMSEAEIAEVVAGFARSARICEQGGFDGVEVHAAHGYLIQAFLSPATNRRTDGYGGSPAGRGRILEEVVRAIRAATGPGFVVGVRVTGDEVQEGGLDADACAAAAAAIAPEVDYVSVVSGSLASYDRIVPDGAFPRGLNVPLAARIRRAVGSTPVLVTGRIAEPAEADRVVADGHADLVGMARALIADAAWVRRAEEGRAHDIRPCVYSNDCRDSIGGRRALSCMVNPLAGHEADPPPEAATTRSVLVVGGGVAGLEAALAGHERGDRVVLVERGDALGGQVAVAASAPGRGELRRLVDHLADRVRVAGIEVVLGREADAALVADVGPDLVVVATGAGSAPAADGVAATAWDVLHGRLLDADEVVVHDAAGGNGWPVFSTAEILAARGHRVVLVTGASSLGTGIEAASVPPLLRRLREAGVRIEMLASAVVRPGGVAVVRRDTGEETERPGAALVAEVGRRSRSTAGPWDDLGVPVHVVGDALAPRRVATAVAEARRAVAAH